MFCQLPSYQVTNIKFNFVLTGWVLNCRHISGRSLGDEENKKQPINEVVEGGNHEGENAHWQPTKGNLMMMCFRIILDGDREI